MQQQKEEEVKINFMQQESMNQLEMIKMKAQKEKNKMLDNFQRKLKLALEEQRKDAQK